MNSVNNVELILIEFSILISLTNNELSLNPITTNVEPNICEMMYVINSNLDINFFENKFENSKFFVWSDDFSGLRDHFPSNKFL